MNANEVIKTASSIAKVNLDSFTNSSKTIEELADFDKWLGFIVNSTGQKIYYKIVEYLKEGYNEREVSFDFFESGEIEITGGDYVRRIFVSYRDLPEDQRIYLKADFRTHDDQDVITERQVNVEGGMPRWYIKGNTIEIVPKPTETIPKGIKLDIIDQYKKLSTISKEYELNGQTQTIEGIPNLKDQILGLPLQRDDIIVYGVAAFLQRREGSIAGASEMDNKFGTELMSLIETLKRRTGNQIRRDRPSHLGQIYN